MSLVTAKPALKNALLSLANQDNSELEKEEAIDSFINALEGYLKSATVTVDSLGLVAPNGPVTGSTTATIT